MVSVKGDRGFHRIREYNDGLDETNLSSQQKAIIRYHKSEKDKQAIKRYFQSEKGRQKMCEMNKKYRESEKGRQKIYEAQKRYHNKPYYCSVCDKHILMKSKYLHLKTQKHLKNI